MIRLLHVIKTFINYTAALDSVSHKYMHAALQHFSKMEQAPRPGRAILYTILQQGDVMLPVLFILVLDQFMQDFMIPTFDSHGL